MRTAQLHLQRSTEALLGYLQGITCDDHLSDLEIANLQGWLETHHALRKHYPFSEGLAWDLRPGMWHSSQTRLGGRPGCDSTPHHAPRKHYPFSEGLAWDLRPGMWHSRPGCDFAPPGASKSAPQAGTPVDLALDTYPAYELIDMATRQLHGVLHGIQSDGKVTEDEVYGLRDWLEHFHVFRGAWPFSEAFALVDQILEDHHVSAEELNQLHTFCDHFSERPTYLRPSAPTFEMRWRRNTSATRY